MAVIIDGLGYTLVFLDYLHYLQTILSLLEFMTFGKFIFLLWLVVRDTKLPKNSEQLSSEF